MFIGAPGLLLLARPLAAERESKGSQRLVLTLRLSFFTLHADGMCVLPCVFYPD